MLGRIGFAIAWILLLSWASASASTSDMQATIRFGTACAQCHEGECSGRKSFALRPEATFTHIRQYAGPIDDTVAHALHTVLQRMKSECRYAMPPVATLPDGELAGTGLSKWHDTWSGSYFIPLPDLTAGSYQLTGQAPGGVQIRIELVDGQFDPWVDECTRVQSGRFELTFPLPAIRGGFLRLRPDGPHPIARLSFVALD